MGGLHEERGMNVVQPFIHGAKYWTPKRILDSGESSGRPSGQLPGSHVLDLSDLKKALTLCDSCLPKFDSKTAGYVTKKNLPLVQGRCDGCQEMTAQGHLLVNKEFADNM